MEHIHYGRKRRGIKSEIVKKVQDWLESIKDEKVKELAAKNTVVTGGSIASMLLGEQVNDYDIYFRNKETALEIAKYYVDRYNEKNESKTKEGVAPCLPVVREEKIVNIRGNEEDRVVIFIKSAGVAGEDQPEYAYFESMGKDAAQDFLDKTLQQIKEDEKENKKDKYRPIFMSQNAITLSGKIQLIIRFYGTPQEIHDSFDFVHATCYYDYGNEELNLNQEALESLMCRHLVYKGSLYPIASIFRMKKFLERGWRITAGQQLKIMWQISEIDLKRYEVLREQLTGVDFAYMHQLIDALHGVDTDKITSSYVGALIDRIFD